MQNPLMRDPVYVQLNQVLRKLLSGTEFHPGDRFLTEREVAARFQVSRATANKALSNLVSEGRLIFRKGLGTFVGGDHYTADLRDLVSFTAKALAAGKRPETRVLHFATVPAAQAAQAAKALTLQEEEPLHYLQRLRLVNDHAMIFEERWVVASLAPQLREEHCAGSLYNAFVQHCTIQVGWSDQDISAVLLFGSDAQRLDCAEGSPALLVRATGYTADARALWFEHTLYRGDGCYFLNRVGRGPETEKPITPGLTTR